MPVQLYAEEDVLQYANELRGAVLKRNYSRIEGLVGKGHAIKESILFKRFRDRQSMRNFFRINEVDIFVTAIQTKFESRAWIYYISTNHESGSDLGRLDRLKERKFSKDYFVCEVVLIDRKWSMPEHVCYDETDVFD
jgi:hypothetical protein